MGRNVNDIPISIKPVPKHMAKRLMRCNMVRLNIVDISSDKDICDGGASTSISTDSSPIMRRNDVTDDLAVTLMLSTAGAKVSVSFAPTSPKRVRAPAENCPMGSVGAVEGLGPGVEEDCGLGGGAPFRDCNPSRRPMEDERELRSMQFWQ